MSESIESLYQADYRLRRIVRRCLENQVLTSQGSSTNHRFVLQLALCYKIGFGGSRDDRKAQELLERNGESLQQLYLIIDRMKEIGLGGSFTEAGELYRSLQDRGLLSEMQFIDQCLEHGKIEEASRALEQEIEQIKYFVGPHSPLWLFHARKLMHLYKSQALPENFNELSRQVKKVEIVHGGWQGTQELEAKISKSKKREMGQDSSFAQVKRMALYSAAMNQGPLDDAIELGLQRLESRIQLMDRRHLPISSHMHDMALNSATEGKQKDAELEVGEEQGLQVKEIMEQTTGNLDPARLPILRSTALIYKERGDWESAKELEFRIVSTLKDLFRLDHPDAVISMINLGRTYQHLAQRSEALELFMDLMEKLKRELGDEDGATLESMNILALAYRIQGRPQEAEELDRHVKEVKKNAPSLRVSQELLSGHRSELSQVIGGQVEENKLDFDLIMVPDSVIPDGWERQSKDDGQPYWIDQNTHTTTWKQPILLSALHLVPAGWDFRRNRKGQIYWVDHNSRTATFHRPEYIPKGWESRKNSSGRTYWVDHVRKTTTFKKPFYLPPGWEAREDHLGRKYYIDHGTNTKKWNLPHSMDFFKHLPADWVPKNDGKGRIYWVDPDPLPQDIMEETLPLIDLEAFGPPPPGQKLAKDRFKR